MKKIFLSLSFLISTTSFASDIQTIIPKANLGRGWFVPTNLRICLEQINKTSNYQEWKNIEIDRDTWAKALIESQSYIGGRNDKFGKESLTKLLFFGGKKEFELKEEEQSQIDLKQINNESESNFSLATNQFEQALKEFNLQLQSHATLLTAQQRCGKHGQIFELLKLQEMAKALKEIQRKYNTTSEKCDEIAQTFSPK